MASNIETAYNEILGAFKTTWDAGAGAYNGSVVPEAMCGDEVPAWMEGDICQDHYDRQKAAEFGITVEQLRRERQEQQEMLDHWEMGQ